MLSCHSISLRLGSLPCDRLPHRSFGLFRGWTGSCQARGQEEPLGGPRHSQRVTFSPKQRARRATLHGDAGAPSRDRDSSLWMFFLL